MSRELNPCLELSAALTTVATISQHGTKATDCTFLLDFLMAMIRDHYSLIWLQQEKPVAGFI